MHGAGSGGSCDSDKLPVTVLVAVKNEVLNLPHCLASVVRAERSIVVDSNSTDGTQAIARMHGAELVQFNYTGGYPKKRQWALDSLAINTPWILLLDADEVVPEPLWNEIGRAITRPDAPDAFLITKGFHFLGRRLRHGGFSHAAVLLFRQGTARFERLFDDDCGGLDMEIHERVLVEGRIARLDTPLIHEDFKGLEAYISRHNAYSTWEARLRHRYISQGQYGEDTIPARLFGNSQERRRFLKAFVIRLPFEPWLWFFYHYIAQLGFLEGRAGLIASQVRANYIAQVRAKMFELRARRFNPEVPDGTAARGDGVEA
jgi:glycosyltransferase involved in cell wall biosynthesis